VNRIAVDIKLVTYKTTPFVNDTLSKQMITNVTASGLSLSYLFTQALELESFITMIGRRFPKFYNASQKIEDVM
jgi:hypothetical protein